MNEDKIIMFRNRLEKVNKHLSKQARRSGITAYRIYDHDLPEFPFSIERYDDKLYVAEYKRRHGLTEEEHDQWLDESLLVVSEILSIPKERIYTKLRQRKAGRFGQYQRLGVAKDEFIVEENGLRFIINLADYLDTGLFLDHRDTRRLVKELSSARNVLNLFCYTGSFSVYAASGGAKEVVSVDLSKTYLAWAKKNMEQNAFIDPSRFQYIHADVKQYLGTVKDNTFGLIVMDPPTFSNSKRMEDFLDIQKDHVVLINECLRILEPGGIIIFSTNYRQFIFDMEKINTPLIKDITKTTTPFDFSGKLYRLCYRIQKE